MNQDLANLLSQTQAMFNEEGISYKVKELLALRSDQLADEIEYAEANGLKYGTIKVPSGCEVNIPLELIKHVHAL